MTVKDLLNLTPEKIIKMNEKELRKATQTLSSASNKRVKRLKERGLEKVSTALQGAKRTNKNKDKSLNLFSTRGKNINQLRHEFIRNVNFLSAKTSTVKGAQVLERDVYQNLFGVNYSKLSKKDKARLWGLFHRVTELPSYQKGGVNYYKGVKMVKEVFAERKSKNFDELINDLTNRINKEYESRYYDDFDDDNPLEI